LNLDYRVRDIGANRNLAILDMKTGEIVNLCIPGGETPYQPIWSPDGKYLVVTVWKNGDSEVMLVDLERSLANKVTNDNDKTAKGWLVSE